MTATSHFNMTDEVAVRGMRHTVSIYAHHMRLLLLPESYPSSASASRQLTFLIVGTVAVEVVVVVAAGIVASGEDTFICCVEAPNCHMQIVESSPAVSSRSDPFVIFRFIVVQQRIVSVCPRESLSVAAGRVHSKDNPEGSTEHTCAIPVCVPMAMNNPFTSVRLPQQSIT